MPNASPKRTPACTPTSVRWPRPCNTACCPTGCPTWPGLDLAFRYLPGAGGVDIGGDWYDAIPLDDDRLMIVVGDVSGRGLHAGTVMASLRYSIRAFASQGDMPATVLAKLTRLLDVGTDRHFATVLCVVVDIAGHTITVSNAGHPNPILIVGDTVRPVETTVGVPIGVSRDATYETVTEAIPPLATLLAFTDGLFERRGESVDDGFERLRELGAVDARITRRAAHPDRRTPRCMTPLPTTPRSWGCDGALVDEEPASVNVTAEVSFDDEGTAVIRVAGEIDIATADTVRQAVAVAIEPGPTHLVFDLSGVDFIDSSGLAVLLEAAKTAGSVRIDPAVEHRATGHRRDRPQRDVRDRRLMDSRRFPNRSTSVRQARRFVADQLSELAPDLVEAVTLMVSELATNCVRHADADFTVSVQFETDRVRVVVADDGPGSPQLRSPTPSEPYGRGLQIVSEFSDEWGLTRRHGPGPRCGSACDSQPRRESGATTASDRTAASAATALGRGSNGPPANPSITSSTGSARRPTIGANGPTRERACRSVGTVAAGGRLEPPTPCDGLGRDDAARPSVSAPAMSPVDAGRPPSWSGSDTRSSSTCGWRSWRCRRTPDRSAIALQMPRRWAQSAPIILARPSAQIDVHIGTRVGVERVMVETPASVLDGEVRVGRVGREERVERIRRARDIWSLEALEDSTKVVCQAYEAGCIAVLQQRE